MDYKILKNQTIQLPTLSGRVNSSPELYRAAEFLAKYLRSVIDEDKEVVLFGDFDADGTCSAAIFYLFAKLLRIDRVYPFVSKRAEGYGLNMKAVARLIVENKDRSGKALVVGMDLGISTTEEAKKMLDNGFAIQIIDHHMPRPGAKDDWDSLKKDYPGMVAVYDPFLYKSDEERSLSSLSAAGLTYKILTLILTENLSGLAERVLEKDKVIVNLHSKEQSIQAILSTMAKQAAIAQAADCMPYATNGKLTEAWHMAKEFELPSKLLAGIGVLYKLTHTASRIPWVIGPIINAAGRLQDAYSAFELMIETEEVSATEKIANIQEIRKRVQSLTKYAEENLSEDVLTSKGVVVGMGKDGVITSGVIGIAAARASEHFSAPAVYLCREEHNGQAVLKGSMRRGETDFSCEEWILKLREENIIFAGGGHPAAAGITLYADKLPELLASAEKQAFKATPKLIYEASIEDLNSYSREVVKTMPYGKGHESALIKIRGLLTHVDELKTTRDNIKHTWAYNLRINETEGDSPVVVKLMRGEITDKMAASLSKIAGKSILAGVEAVVSIHDNFKLNSRYERADPRVAAHYEKNSGELDEKEKTTSGRKAMFCFLEEGHYINETGGIFAEDVSKKDSKEGASKTDEKSLSEGSAPKAKKEDKTKESSSTAVSEKADKSEKAESPKKTESANSDLAQAPQLEDVNVRVVKKISPVNYTDLSSEDAASRIFVEIDFPKGTNPRHFVLRRPPRQKIEELVGSKGLETLSDMHGGLWDQSLRAYLISFGVMENLANFKDPRFKIMMSSSALAHYKKIQDNIKLIEEEKKATSKYPVPFLKEESRTRPLPFQYVDVKIFTSRHVALCGNDMGTGKTFESGMWAAFRLAGTLPDQFKNYEELSDKNMLTFDKKITERPPVLFVGLKSVFTQFMNETEAHFNVPQTSFITEDVRKFLIKHGFEKDVTPSTEGVEDGEHLMLIHVNKESKSKAKGGKKKGRSSNDEKNIKQIRSVPDSIKEAFQKEFIKDAGFVFTTYDTIARHPWIVSMYSWSGLVVDEAHELKGQASIRTRALFGEKIDGEPIKNAPVMALSGTFANNRPGDWFVWTRLTRADGGIYTGGGLSEAHNRFSMRFDGLRWKEIRIRGGKTKLVQDRGIPKNGEELKELIYPYIVRRMKTEITEIPNIVQFTHRVSTTGLYTDVIRMLKGEAEIEDESQRLLTKYKLLDKKGNLRGESFKDDDELGVIDPNSVLGKLSLISSLDKACGIVPTLIERGYLPAVPKDASEPFVIVAFHQCAAQEISERLSAAGVPNFLMIQSDSFEEREDKKARFQKGEGIAFVTTFGIGGVGLNLNRANKIIAAGLPWNDARLEQARDRVFRLGQKRDVEFCIMLLSASVDEGIFYMIKNKAKATTKTTGVDQYKDGVLPSWATGGVLLNSLSSSSGTKSPRRKKMESIEEKKKKELEELKNIPDGYVDL